VSCRAYPRQATLAPSTGLNISPGSDDDGWVVPPPVQLSDGTRVQLYKDGEALHAAYEAIKHAKRRICVETYIFADDPTGNAFAELLAEKARDGVKVYCIYDSFGSFGVSALWSRKPPLFKMMRRAGVRLQEFHPIRPWEGRYSWRPINRDHRKLLIIDDDIAGTGWAERGSRVRRLLGRRRRRRSRLRFLARQRRRHRGPFSKTSAHQLRQYVALHHQRRDASAVQSSITRSAIAIWAFSPPSPPAAARWRPCSANSFARRNSRST
jgi:hypothetical protein